MFRSESIVSKRLNHRRRMFSYLVAECEGEDVAVLFCDLDGKRNQIVSADWHNFAGECELVRLGGRVDILRDELLGFLRLDRHHGTKEVDESVGLVQLREEEVHAACLLLDVENVAVCVVLENKLLEMQHCPLVENLLSDLYRGPPHVGGETLLAVEGLVT